jgi:predicted PurR-regulated permease PerM
MMSALERIWFPRTSKRFLQKTRRPACLIISALAVSLIVVLVVALILPQLVDCARVLVNAVPGWIRTTIAQLEEWGLLSQETYDALASIDWKSKLESSLGIVMSGVGNLFQTLVSVIASVFGGLMTAMIAVIFAVYLQLSKETLAAQMIRLGKRFLRPRWLERVLHVLSVMHDSFRKFIVCQCAEAVILGLLCLIGMWILRLPYAAMVSTLVAFTALIPVAGCYIGALGGAFMILTVSPVKALIFLVFIIVLQQLENNLIYPRVVGASIGLPGIWVLVAVTVGGGMLGITGMMIAVPLGATLYKLLREYIRATSKEEARDSTATEAEELPRTTTPREPKKASEKLKRKSKKGS